MNEQKVSANAYGISSAVQINNNYEQLARVKNVSGGHDFVHFLK